MLRLLQAVRNRYAALHPAAQRLAVIQSKVILVYVVTVLLLFLIERLWLRR